MSPALRKAAILISALDSASADRLLEQMGEQQAARVRNAIMMLDDVPADEQETILAEFFGQPSSRGKQSPHDFAEHHQGVELELSPQATSAAIPAGPRFEFLIEAPSEPLARRLSHEHPQLIALVIAHLPAEKAAQLLERLPEELAEEVLGRLADFEDADPEIVADLERQLHRLFATTIRPRRTGGKRQEQVQAILEHLGKSRGETIEPTPLLQQAEPEAAQLPEPPPEVVRENRFQPIPFEQLLSLPTDEFFAVFEEADPRIVMLALAGAPRRLFERYLGQFESGRALEFERHLEQLRPLRLRDVEAAQHELAIIAGRQREAAKTAAESSRRFAAAA